MHVSLSVLQTVDQRILPFRGRDLRRACLLPWFHALCAVCVRRLPRLSSIHFCVAASPVLSCTQSHHNQEPTVEMTAKIEATASRKDSASLPFPIFYTDSTAALTSHVPIRSVLYRMKYGYDRKCQSSLQAHSKRVDLD